MNPSAKPPVHLWIYNHQFFGISDQVDYFVTALAQQGYQVSVGRQPSQSALNVVIENFTAESKRTLADFCRSTRKRVAVIMTEHIDFDGRQIFVHGDPLWSDNDYMHPAVQVGRIKNLMDCLSSIRCFIVLGDLPELRGMSVMLPGVPVHAIPFPGLEKIADAAADAFDQNGEDLLFTGIVTDYRAQILAALDAQGFSVHCPNRLVSRNVRNALNRASKIILNLPQRQEWRWLSLMRIIAGLRCGRATVSLGTSDQSKIAGCCAQLDITRAGWLDELRRYVADWRSQYLRAIEDYGVMAAGFERDHPFPHELFEYWAITDRLDTAVAVPSAAHC